jgi:hypothetical protein
MIGFWNHAEAETGCLCTDVFVSEYTRHGWDRTFFSSQRRDSHMLWDTCVNVSACLANIQYATALTVWHVNWYTTCDLRVMGILSLNGKKTRKATRGIYNTKDKAHTCSKKIVYFCLPFTGRHGLHIRSQLSKVLASAYPHIFIYV